MKNLLFILMFISLSNLCLSQGVWDTTYLNFNDPCSDISFVNPNTGFSISYTANDRVTINKTTNKGVNWSLVSHISSTSGKSKNAAIIFKSPELGFISYDNKIAKYDNGNFSNVFTFPNYSLWHRVIFVSDQTGYALFSYLNDVVPNNLSYSSIYKTTNGGDNWFVTSADGVLSQNGTSRFSCLRDIDFSKNNTNELHAVGYYVNGIGSQGISAHVYTTNGYSNFTIGGDAVSGSKFGHVTVTDNEVRILGSKGLKINVTGQTTYAERYVFFSPSVNSTELGMCFINSSTGYIALHSGKLVKTTNSGNNWNDEINIDHAPGEFESARIVSFGDIVYYRSAVDSKFYAKKLFINILTYFDNQSASNSFIIEDTNYYNTPTSDYLRGGFSSLSSVYLLDSSQTNEKIFYKWNDGYMYSDHEIGQSNGFDFYFDMSGTDIANYYKTKQLSTVYSSIANASQTKSVRDTTVNNVTATHTIHESIGGIFYSKSTNYGATYQTEEVVNLSDNPAAADGNKYAYLTVMRASGGQYPITTADANRNVAVVWEKYNYITQQTEIKFAHRVLNTQQDGYEWESYDITSFSAPSGFESKPKCFVAVSPGQTQEGPFLIIVPHLRPNGSQNKIFTSVRYTPNLSQDYELENGYIQDLAVASPFNYYSSYIVHFAYLKDDKVAYRKEEFGYYNGNIYRRTSPPPEVNNNISSGDGYQSRYKPDISLMNGFPVVSYSANYNSQAWVEYEGGETDVILINRYPIIKVHRKTIDDWGNYVIYNSTNVQDNPDIEGSQDTKSYLINYSIGNGQFKKVVNVDLHPGYFCDPDIFTGTDSKLIKNSYTGLYGSNLSLLTLSPNSGLYKLDKQNFNITNIITAEDYDNLGGVVNLDTVRYSFNLGPILIKEPDDGIEEVSFGENTDPAAPVITPVEFNQNLRSNTFLLNESQALLVGFNATYIKDDIDAVVNEVQYNVNLMNKTTGLLHRVLFSDTVHADDSVAIEYLRGFYISGIPNGEDSFYVQISVNNNDIADGDYNVNPGYDDDEEIGDNSSGYRTKIIFEPRNVHNATGSIPAEYSLNQNYPNPFNPTTTISFAIPTEGRVKIIIYDITGKEIQALVNEFKQAGKYSVSFNRSNVASGIYFYKIETGSFVQTRKMSLIK